MHVRFWGVAAVIIASSGLLGCRAALDQLPPTAAAAFALDPRTLERGEGMEAFILQGSPQQALNAAQESLAEVGFVIEAPAATAERRCGSRAGSQDEGRTWACFYVRRGAADRTEVRLITATGRAIGPIIGRRHDLEELAATFRERSAASQSR